MNDKIFIRDYIVNTCRVRNHTLIEDLDVNKILSYLPKVDELVDIIIIDSFEKRCLSLFIKGNCVLVYDDSITRHLNEMNFSIFNGKPIVYPLLKLFAEGFYCHDSFGVAWSLLNDCEILLLDDFKKNNSNASTEKVSIYTKIQKMFILSHEYAHLFFYYLDKAKQSQYLHDTYNNFKESIFRGLDKSKETFKKIDAMYIENVINETPSFLEEFFCDQLAMRIISEMFKAEYSLIAIFQSLMLCIFYLNLITSSDRLIIKLIEHKEEDYLLHLTTIRFMYLTALFSTTSFSNITNEKDDNIFYKKIDKDLHFWNLFNEYSPHIIKVFNYIAQNYNKRSLSRKSRDEVIEYYNAITRIFCEVLNE